MTGASQGIGRAVTERLSRDGFRVIALARNGAALKALAEESWGAQVTPLVADLADEEASIDALSRLEAGTIEVLVNNAGIAESAPFLKTDRLLWDKTMLLNVEAPFWLTKAVLPDMLEAGSGTVINIASTAAIRGFAYVSSYCASKHALLGLTRSLAAEYAKSGVTFNCVCPHFVDTPMTEKSIMNIVERTGCRREEAVKPLLTPQERLVSPQEVAAVVSLLASPGGRGINGEAIAVDGGFSRS